MRGPPAQGKGVKIGPWRLRAPRRVPRKVMKEVWIGPCSFITREARKRKKHPFSLFKKIKNKGLGGLFVL